MSENKSETKLCSIKNVRQTIIKLKYVRQTIKLIYVRQLILKQKYLEKNCKTKTKISTKNSIIFPMSGGPLKLRFNCWDLRKEQFTRWIKLVRFSNFVRFDVLTVAGRYCGQAFCHWHCIDCIAIHSNWTLLSCTMEQHALKNLNNYLNTKSYSYLETSGGQSSFLYLNVVPFLTPVLVRHLWQVKTVAFLHCCLMCIVLLKILL